MSSDEDSLYERLDWLLMRVYYLIAMTLKLNHLSSGKRTLAAILNVT